MITKINNRIVNVGYNQTKIEKQQNLDSIQNSAGAQFPPGLNIHLYTGNISAQKISFKNLALKSTDLIEEAAQFAQEKHGSQLYGHGLVKHPYTYHTQGVAQLVSEYTDDPEVIAAAHLHDTLEDTDATYEELCSKFGKRVADLVLGVTTNKEEKARLGKAKVLGNKMKTMNEDSLLIKLCDRKFNVDNLDDADKDFKRRYALETCYIMEKLIDGRANIPPVCRKIAMDIVSTLDNMAF